MESICKRMHLFVCVVADTPSRYEHWLKDGAHEAPLAYGKRGDISEGGWMHIISADARSTFPSTSSFANSSNLFAKEDVEFEHMLVVRKNKEMLAVLRMSNRKVLQP